MVNNFVTDQPYTFTNDSTTAATSHNNQMMRKNPKRANLKISKNHSDNIDEDKSDGGLMSEYLSELDFKSNNTTNEPISADIPKK